MARQRHEASRSVGPKRSKKTKSKKKGCCNICLGVLSTLLFIVAIVLGSFAVAGCSGEASRLPDMFIRKLHLEESPDPIKVHVGYYGTCVSANLTTTPPVAKTVCFGAGVSTNVQELTDEFLDAFSKSNTFSVRSKTNMTQDLSRLLAVSQQLQRDVFNAGIPTAFVCTFFISGLLLLVLLTNVGKTTSYKSLLAAAIVLATYALALGFSALFLNDNATAGSRIVPKQLPGDGDDRIVVVARGGLLQPFLWAAVSIAAIFQFFMAVLYVRSERKKVPTAFANAFSYMRSAWA